MDKEKFENEKIVKNIMRNLTLIHSSLNSIENQVIKNRIYHIEEVN